MFRTELIPSGVPALGSLPWGSHFCQFYKTRQDLIDTLVPFFRAGLQGHERCLWITSDPLPAVEAQAMLALVIPGLHEYLATGQIEIRDFADWYRAPGSGAAQNVLDHWLKEEREALSQGYTGLRLTGNASFVESSGWTSFMEYEKAVHSTFRNRRIMALCSYPLARCTPSDIVEVLRHHDFALARREGEWELIQSPIGR